MSKLNLGVDILTVKENYQNKTDDELIYIVTTDAIGLTPEALEIVKEEIVRRKLDTNLIKGLEAQNKHYTIEELDKYCDLIKYLNCPICQLQGSVLNATLTSEVMSFLFFTQWNKKLKVGCPDCLDKANESALAKTTLLGWWGIPWGIIKTIQAIRQNIKSKKTNHSDSPNDFLRSYVLSKIGEIETYKDKKEKLQQIISID